MAVLDLEPKDVSLDEPLRSQEMIMLKEVLFVEESGRATSPVAGLQTAHAQNESLPSALASCEYTLPIAQLRRTLAAKQAHAVEVSSARAEDQPAAKRQQTAPPVLFEAESHPSMECALQSPFASAEHIDHFLEDLPESSPAAQQLQQLQQYRQHSAPPPSTLSRALLESQSQELSLQHILSTEQAKARVSTLPTSKQLLCGNLQASLSPVVWRDFEAPHRVMVNLGLRCLETESNTGYPASMYAAFNPRVITTGVPPKRSHPYQRESSPPDARQTRSKMTRSASLGSNLTRSQAAPACPAAKKEHVELEEVYLLKRNPDSMLVEDTWHVQGPFEGNTLTAPPVWPGAWLIDVLACIHESSDGRSFWLKAMHRSVPAAPPVE